MSSRAGRLRALVVGSGIAVLLIAAGTATSAAGTGASRSTNPGSLTGCAKLLLGEAGAPARAVPGSASPQVAAELSIFRSTRTRRDALPAAHDLGRALGGAEATTYDPSASVRLHLGKTASGPVYAVPATLAAPKLPARCRTPRALAGLRAVFAVRTLETGSGPGVCLINTQVVHSSAVSILPGKRRPGKRTHTVADARCESLATMASYLGMFGGVPAEAGPPVVLIADGVSSVAYTLADGRQVTAPASGNLLTLPASLSRPIDVTRWTRATLRRALDARAPVTITEDDANGVAVASFTRPASLISELVSEVLALRRSSVDTTSGTEQSYVSCSARTHRCVAVVVSTTCDPRHHRCDATRRIDRYRYVGRRPPPGTTHGVVVPTAPIRARLNRYLLHPSRKLSLVLSGAPRRQVDALVSVACFSGPDGASSAGMGESPLQVAVPSRTTLTLPGHQRACGVDVLVVSARRGPIHVRLSRTAGRRHDGAGSSTENAIRDRAERPLAPTDRIRSA